MRIETDHCPVCRSEQFKILELTDFENRARITCETCGEFVIGGMAAFRLRGELEPDARLSAWIRWHKLTGSDPPEILQESLEKIRSPLPKYAVHERARELLKALTILSKNPGFRVGGNLFSDAPLGWAQNADEIRFHFQTLLGRRWLSLFEPLMDGSYEAVVSAEGWRVIEEGGAILPARAFVAMSFSDEMQDAWVVGLKPGIEKAGYSAHRVDSEPHLERIDLKILGDIRQSRFVVADATQQKTGVYFEAGFALALGKPIVWTVREDELHKVHFDTRQFAHVVWKDPTDLAGQLSGVIVGAIGRGPNSG